jgi:hypothetical protein
MHKILVRKLEGKRLLGKWEENRDVQTQVFELEWTETAL